MWMIGLLPVVHCVLHNTWVDRFFKNRNIHSSVKLSSPSLLYLFVTLVRSSYKAAGMAGIKAREDEARALMHSAKKHCTKSITKWSADWDSAAQDYEKAAQIFTNIRYTAPATEAWEAASHAHEKAGNLFFAAKALESLANLLKDEKDSDPLMMTELYVRASKLYALDNKPEKQADTLAKAARLAPPKDVVRAVTWIQDGINALEQNEKFHLTLDLYRALILTQLRANSIAGAIETLKREIVAFEHLQQPGGASKAGLEIIILCLYMGDDVLADREFKAMLNVFGFPHSKEQAVACELLNAFEERDNDKLQEALKDQQLSFIIIDISRMAKKLKIVGEKRPKPSALDATAAPPAENGEQQQQQQPEGNSPDSDDEENVR